MQIGIRIYLVDKYQVAGPIRGKLGALIAVSGDGRWVMGAVKCVHIDS